uniref:SSD domain-containing protein n=1 Tax=Rodentolepis nana TaxID=102285 RepID=A0A0R3TIG7_RODNA
LSWWIFVGNHLRSGIFRQYKANFLKDWLDCRYFYAVIGMHPRSDMDISLFIEPQTGIVLQALQLIQINAIVARNKNFNELAKLRNLTYLPLGYINTSIFVSDSVARTLITTLFIPQMSISVVGSIMVTGSLLTILVISGIMFAITDFIIFIISP